MGWLEGLLTGYVDRSHEIEKQKMDEAIAANQREAKVYEALLNSPNADIRQMAGAGMLDMANPIRKSKGLKGWMGEVDRSPMLPLIRKYMQTEQPYEHEITPAVPAYTERQQATIPILSTEQARTQLPGHQDVPPPPPPPSAASLPSTSPTEAGTPVMTPPPTPPTPTPPAAQLQAPPPPPPQQPQQLDEEALASTPPNPYNAQTGQYESGQKFTTAVTQTPPPSPPWAPESFPVDREIPGTPAQTETRYALPEAFASRADLESQKIDSEIRTWQGVYRQSGAPDWQQKGIDAVLQQHGRAGSGAGNTFAEGNVIPDASSPTGFSQELYLRADPTKRTRIPAQPPLTPEYMAERAAATTHARNLQNRADPINANSRAALTARYQTMWNGIQTPVRNMEMYLRTMKQSYERYKAGDRAAWEPLRTAFVHVSEPNSVVMPSEFVRAAGIGSLMQQIHGYVGKLKEGGAPLPDEIIDQMMRIAESAWEGTQTYGAQQRAAIEASINDPTVMIPPEHIFGPASMRYDPSKPITAPVTTPTPTPTPTPNPAVTNPAAKTTPAPVVAPPPPPGTVNRGSKIATDPATGKLVIVPN